jgi:GNAT superfamily N-acetyltransferase
MPDIKIHRATAELSYLAQGISDLIAEAARAKDSGLALRAPDFIARKIQEGKAIIALDGQVIAGFIYIESWQNDLFVSHSGLIVNPAYRGLGLAHTLKQAAFDLGRHMFPRASMFGLTTSKVVMRINSELGYRAADFSEITTDNDFWKGCESCQNFDILTRTGRKNCLCTSMVWNPREHQ